MAFRFDGTTSKIELGSALATAEPLTMACRFFPFTVVASTLVCVCSSTSVLGDALGLTTGSTGNPRATSRVSGASANGTSNLDNTRGYVANRWYSAAAIFTSTTSRQGAANGFIGTVNASLSVPLTINRTLIGGEYTNGALARQFEGYIADVAFWNVALTDTEVLAFTKYGVRPDQIRNGSLIAYLPLDTDIYDRASTNVYTNTAATMFRDNVSINAQLIRRFGPPPVDAVAANPSYIIGGGLSNIIGGYF